MRKGTPESPEGRIHPDTIVGHVHLKVADLQRALDFYCGLLGPDHEDLLAAITAGGEWDSNPTFAGEGDRLLSARRLIFVASADQLAVAIEPDPRST